MNFAQLNLNSSLVETLSKLGYNTPTPIQKQAIPPILAGHDVIATAQTGTGKTAAYLLPALERLINHPRKKKLPRILILTPTRELAFQVKDSAAKYSKHLRLEIASILGGMPYNAQLRQLAKPVDIIVATPGRLIDHLEQNRLDLSEIELLVIDEADRMLDMGFVNDVKLIASKIAKSRQTLLFTATLDKSVINLANSILKNPVMIEVLGKQITLENIEQRLHLADDISHKTKLLHHILDAECIHKAIIFSATKRYADILAKQLRELGHQASALHGDMKQAHRNKTVSHLRSGKIYLLVATDVAARGLDIQDISHVINYDLPKVAEDYVHRIGRTGRAGKTGIAISFVSSNEKHLMKQIERYTKQTFEHATIPGLEPAFGFNPDKKEKSNQKSAKYKSKKSSPSKFKSKHSSPEKRSAEKHFADRQRQKNQKFKSPSRSDNTHTEKPQKHKFKANKHSDIMPTENARKHKFKSAKSHDSDSFEYSKKPKQKARPSSDNRRSEKSHGHRDSKKSSRSKEYFSPQEISHKPKKKRDSRSENANRRFSDNPRRKVSANAFGYSTPKKKKRS